MVSKKIKDKVGLRYGRLLVKELSHVDPSKGRYAFWKCLCDCGNETIVKSAHLGKGTNSCGCLARELSAKRIKKTHNTGKHLYFIACGDFIKIGRANNVNQRLSQLRAANPYPVTLIHIVENEGYKEKEMHELFKNQHHSGEWFRLDIG